MAFENLRRKLLIVVVLGMTIEPAATATMQRAAGPRTSAPSNPSPPATPSAPTTQLAVPAEPPIPTIDDRVLQGLLGLAKLRVAAGMSPITWSVGNRRAV